MAIIKAIANDATNQTVVIDRLSAMLAKNLGGSDHCVCHSALDQERAPEQLNMTACDEDYIYIVSKLLRTINKTACCLARGILFP